MLRSKADNIEFTAYWYTMQEYLKSLYC